METRATSKRLLNVGSWNIRHGLAKHEQEMRMWLKKEDLDIAFYVETDTDKIDTLEDYEIDGYETVVPKTQNGKKKRIIAVKKTNMSATTKTREDLMSPDFPSIWIEWETSNKKSTLVCGFYREWTKVGRITNGEQCKIMETFSDQTTRANSEGKDVVMLGDANLDSEKWNKINYRHYQVASEWQKNITRNGMKLMDIGNTFLAEQTKQDGSIIESALDHVYVKIDMEEKVIVTRGTLSATDHLPIVAEIMKPNILQKEVKTKPRTIYKRSMKNFTEAEWKKSVARQDWKKMGRTEDVEEMAKIMKEGSFARLGAERTCFRSN
jgi:exonuclease III